MTSNDTDSPFTMRLGAVDIRFADKDTVAEDWQHAKIAVDAYIEVISKLEESNSPRDEQGRFTTVDQ